LGDYLSVRRKPPFGRLPVALEEIDFEALDAHCLQSIELLHAIRVGEQFVAQRLVGTTRAIALKNVCAVRG